MKKILIFAILVLFTAWPAHAATDPVMINFLESVSAQYYCLSRFGLKNFTADVSFTVVRDTAQELNSPLSDYLDELNNLTFEVSVTSNGKVNVAFKPTSQISGDREIDKAAFKLGQSMSNNLVTYLNDWSHYMIQPLFQSYKKINNSYTLQNTSDGFTILKTNKNETISGNFDHQSKLLNMAEWSGNNSIVTKFNFSKKPEGYVLNDMTYTIRTSQVSVKYEYQTVGDYLLPEKIRSRLNETGFPMNGIAYYFTFTNYKIYQ